MVNVENLMEMTILSVFTAVYANIEKFECLVHKEYVLNY